MIEYIKRKLEGTFSSKQEILDFIKFVRENKDKISDKEFYKETNTKLYNLISTPGDYKDKNDKNQLDWGGTRSSKHFFEHPFQSCPMFFRRNGNSVDLVNLYQGKAVFLIANGPSFKDVDKNLINDFAIFKYCLNNGGIGTKPNIVSVVDDPTRFASEMWEDPTIMKIVPQAHFEKPYWDKTTDNYSTRLVGDCPAVFGVRRNEEFNPEKFLYESTVNWGSHKDKGGGRSVMLLSLRICHLLGFKRVYLVGCDFNMSETQKYWFEEQRTKNAINNNNSTYKLLIERFTQLKPIFDKAGFEVYNLNPNSGLKVFPFMDIEEAVNRERIDMLNVKTEGMYVDRKKGKDD